MFCSVYILTDGVYDLKALILRTGEMVSRRLFDFDFFPEKSGLFCNKFEDLVLFNVVRK